MKGFFIIFYDDIKGPILENRLIYILDPTVEISKDIAEQIFYSLNLKHVGNQNFLKFYIESDEICTFFTSQVQRDDTPVIFNVILDEAEPREKYFGFIKKWTTYIHKKIMSGTPFTINPIIMDIEQRISVVDYQHARFQILGKKNNWEMLKKAQKSPIENSKILDSFQAFGLVDKNGKIKQSDFTNLVDFAVNNDYLHVVKNLPTKTRQDFTRKVLAKLNLIYKLYQQVATFQEMHFLSPDYPHLYFSLFEDAISYKIFQYLKKRSFPTSEDISKFLNLDKEPVEDYLELINNQSPAIVTYPVGESIYVYKLLDLQLNIPYPEDPSKIQIVYPELEKDSDLILLDQIIRKEKVARKKPILEKQELVQVSVTQAGSNVAEPLIPISELKNTEQVHVKPEKTREKDPSPSKEKAKGKNENILRQTHTNQYPNLSEEYYQLAKIFAKWYST